MHSANGGVGLTFATVQILSRTEPKYHAEFRRLRKTRKWAQCQPGIIHRSRYCRGRFVALKLLHYINIGNWARAAHEKTS